MPHGDDMYRLLSIDGGGVRGLSSLMILRHMMDKINSDSPPKPCDYFDMIGGTGTGGLIAIMLGRLRMSVTECITAYTNLCDRAFVRSGRPINMDQNVQGRLSSEELEKAIKAIVTGCGLPENELLKDTKSACKVFVCAFSKETSQPVCFTSYKSPRHIGDLVDITTIWQACRATCASVPLFEPISIGPNNEQFIDCALGYNNPINIMWTEFQDAVERNNGGHRHPRLQCLVSIGSGSLGVEPVLDENSLLAMLRRISLQTDQTAETFQRNNATLRAEGRYYRFNVTHGLERIGIEESSRRREVAAAARNYISSDTVFEMITKCVQSLTSSFVEDRTDHVATIQYPSSKYRVPFSLAGVPLSNKFVPRPGDSETLEKSLIPSRESDDIGRRLCVLHGLGGMGKTQLAVAFARQFKNSFTSIFWLDGQSEDKLKQSLAKCALRIPQDKIPSGRPQAGLNTSTDVDRAVAAVMEWLALPDNTDWLLIFDNVDKEHQVEHPEDGAYDIQKYLPGDHGSVLVTTRLQKLAQLGDECRLKEADEGLSKAMFEKWLGKPLYLIANSEDDKNLLQKLDGLPLAIAQAASYIRENGYDTSSYLRLYNEQWDILMEADQSPLQDYQEKSVATTWMISLDRIQQKNEGAANILRIWAYLDRKDMWYGLLRGLHEQRPYPNGCPAWASNLLANEAAFLGAMKLLVSYSMIEARESAPGSFSMHPVVHQWVLHMQKSNEKLEFLPIAFNFIGHAVQMTLSKSHGHLYRLFSHANTCLEWMTTEWDARHGINDLFTLNTVYLTHFYCQLRRARTAGDLLYWVLHLNISIFGYTHINTRAAATTYCLYATEGDASGKGELIRTLFEETESEAGASAYQTIDTLINLGQYYANTGQSENAHRIAKEAVQRLKTAYCSHLNNTDLWNLVKRLLCQGQIFSMCDVFLDAQEMFEYALGHLKEAGRGNSFDCWEITLKLGDAYVEMGQTVDAERIYRKLYELSDTSHRNIIAQRRGDLYMSQSRFEEAETVLKQGRQDTHDKYGEESFQALVFSYHLGSLYRKVNRLADAEAIFKDVLRICIVQDGDPSPFAGIACDELISIYTSLGREEDKAAMVQRFADFWKVAADFYN